jgi:tubulin polyglutamylase TTLL9
VKVNASPSLASDTPADYALKYGMLEDLLTVVDMERHFTSHGSLKQVGERKKEERKIY